VGERTLHLIDLNNLLGSRWAGPAWPLGWPRPAAVRDVLEAYRVCAAAAPRDHQVIVATPRLAVEAKLASPASRVVLRRGNNVGQSIPADLHADWCAAHYDRVVIGSGHASVVSTLSALAERGLAIRVVTRRGSVSPALAETLNVLVAMRGPRRELGATA
jgi:hypothetical protein